MVLTGNHRRKELHLNAITSDVPAANNEFKVASACCTTLSTGAASSSGTLCAAKSCRGEPIHSHRQPLRIWLPRRRALRESSSRSAGLTRCLESALPPAPESASRSAVTSNALALWRIGSVSRRPLRHSGSFKPVNHPRERRRVRIRRVPAQGRFDSSCAHMNIQWLCLVTAMSGR
jgi:hypothetical protein